MSLQGTLVTLLLPCFYPTRTSQTVSDGARGLLDSILQETECDLDPEIDRSSFAGAPELCWVTGREVFVSPGGRGGQEIGCYCANPLACSGRYHVIHLKHIEGSSTS